jgi:hypothetical protein
MVGTVREMAARPPPQPYSKIHKKDFWLASLFMFTALADRRLFVPQFNYTRYPPGVKRACPIARPLLGQFRYKCGFVVSGVPGRAAFSKPSVPCHLRYLSAQAAANRATITRSFSFRHARIARVEYTEWLGLISTLTTKRRRGSRLPAGRDSRENSTAFPQTRLRPRAAWFRRTSDCRSRLNECRADVKSPSPNHRQEHRKCHRDNGAGPFHHHGTGRNSCPYARAQETRSKLPDFAQIQLVHSFCNLPYISRPGVPAPLLLSLAPSAKSPIVSCGLGQVDNPGRRLHAQFVSHPIAPNVTGAGQTRARLGLGGRLLGRPFLV